MAAHQTLDALQLHDNWLLRIADHRGLKRSDPRFQAPERNRTPSLAPRNYFAFATGSISSTL